MILDKLLQFDPAGTLANAIIVAGVDSTNILDLSVARDIAIRTRMRPVIRMTITTAFLAAAGAASLIIQFQGSADNVTYNVLAQTDQGGIPKANLVAGTIIDLPLGTFLGQPQAVLPRYLKCTYKALTNPFTAGVFETDLVIDPQASNPPAYPAGVNIAN